jgi:hypothetical protein
VALRVGADAWARGITTSKRQLTSWARKPPRQLATAITDTEAWSGVELVRRELVDRTMTLLHAEFPWMSQLDDQQLARSGEDINYIFEFLAVSLLVDDDRIFVDFLVWLSGVLTNRNLPPSTVRSTLPVLTQALAASHQLTPRIEHLLESATASLPAAVPPRRGASVAPT